MADVPQLGSAQYGVSVFFCQMPVWQRNEVAVLKAQCRDVSNSERELQSDENPVPATHKGERPKEKKTDFVE